MEGSAYTDRTIDLYRRLRQRGSARRDRAPGVPLPDGLRHRRAACRCEPAIRLVKGAYAEPRDIAFVSKRDVDSNYLALCVFMLPEVKRRKLRLVLATHDVELIARAWRFAQALEMSRSEIEVAMLYGIRTDEQLRLAREGFVVSDLIAYGDAWYAWYLRRLAERPANVWFVARQLLP